MVRGSLPWNQREGKRRWEDVDSAGYYRYMETFYGITGKEKMDNGLPVSYTHLDVYKRQGLKIINCIKYVFSKGV